MLPIPHHQRCQFAAIISAAPSKSVLSAPQCDDDLTKSSCCATASSSLQILRAAGFNYARPAVIDTVIDLAARYLLLLASSTAQNAFNNHNSFVPTIQDVRIALYEAGALRPQLSVLEEEAKGLEEKNGEMVPYEDLRGVDGFVGWAQGQANKEIRRVAGYGVDGEVGEIAAGLDDQEDYLTGRLKALR